MRCGFDDLPGSLPVDNIPQNLDINTTPFSKIAEEALNQLSETAFDNGALWRDHLSMTGQVRTFYGSARIKEHWTSYAQKNQPHNFRASAGRISRPTPNSSWVDVSFTFVTRQEADLVGNCSGIISFLPSEDKTGWKVWMLRTLLENFEGHGHPDDPSPIFQASTTATKLSVQLKHEVSVLIIGAGQAGLSLAGRLGALSIPYLLLEKESEIGWSWTGKYDGVRQHTIREMNNLPFDRTYKATDPDLLPAKIVAEGFQNYVKKYNINVWLPAEVEKCERDSGELGWIVSVLYSGEIHVVKAKHLVLSMGAGRSVPNPPTISNSGSFKGAILDIGTYKNSTSWKGKKGVVVGSATGAHDVAQDMLDNGLSSIMMIQRGKTPVFPMEWCAVGQAALYNLDIPPPVADRLESTTPLKISREVLKTHFAAAAAAEHERFDALERIGFRVDREAVLYDWIFLRGGGYYIDVGTSARIANGDIKVKSGDAIRRFVENGLEFESGDVVEADVVVFATGYQRDPRLQAASIVGQEVAKSMRISKGLDEDGELEGTMIPVGKALWLMSGAVSMARWNSRFIALQIQAELMGKPFPDSRWDVNEGAHAKELKL
ncbi:related to flavin-containing monooxygenase [Phialocephala subalpina]|uniref:Related to flavin-containing monooxygenase n=1 Tax=Phialocephala subalpina TaxID=576137 RepID=A0A1L7XPJ1_9HELO|nr:related to flavin-containing monooxygenase [Phialocephala subalpina]